MAAISNRPTPDEEEVWEFERFLTSKFRLPGLSCFQRLVRYRSLEDGFAADVVLFDGGKCTLIVKYWYQQYEVVRWYFRGPREHRRPFYYSKTRKEWTRAEKDEYDALMEADEIA